MEERVIIIKKTAGRVKEFGVLTYLAGNKRLEDHGMKAVECTRRKWRG